MGFSKKKKDRAVRPKVEKEPEVDTRIVEDVVEAEVQQKVLDVFRTAFECILDVEALKPRLESVRVALEARDLTPFAQRDEREAYCVRWSPGTALTLAALLGGWCDGELCDVSVFNRLRGEVEGGAAVNVVSFGGGPAELMAVAALLRHAEPGSVGGAEENGGRKVNLHLVDSADWSGEVETLNKALTAPPVLSKYASASAKAAAVPFLAPSALGVEYHRVDILGEWKEKGLDGMIGAEPAIITIASTLPALQSQSVSKTMKFLMQLTKTAPKNSLLLVVDELEADVKTGSKRYPLEFLLELALLGKGVSGDEESDDEDGEKKGEAPWERLVGDEERYFEVDESHKYPLSLGFVECQVHLFRRK